MSFGELMAEAGTNTLLGMGTVFAVLILISFIISCFKFLNKATPKAEPKKDSVDKAVEQIVATEEVADDDTEIAAVIAAAIAAFEGSKSASGYVVRSIRRLR